MKAAMFLFSVLVLLSGCSTLPPGGVLYSNTAGPIYATDRSPNKKGKSCASGIPGLIMFGDASIRKAMQNANLGRAAVVDYEQTTVLSFTKYCTVVYGPRFDIPPPEE
ncbi:TRL-like family protein [Halomonas heilongjiangensis]|nr:TRL-like family protein [Halomonas heilongjiangensis]